MGGEEPSTLLYFSHYHVHNIVVERSHTDSLNWFSKSVAVCFSYELPCTSSSCPPPTPPHIPTTSLSPPPNLPGEME